MAAISKNKYDVFMWIKKVILSCKTWKQIRVAFNLISNFQEMYNDKFLTKILDTTFVDKEEEIMTP